MAQIDFNNRYPFQKMSGNGVLDGRIYYRGFAELMVFFKPVYFTEHTANPKSAEKILVTKREKCYNNSNI